MSSFRWIMAVGLLVAMGASPFGQAAPPASDDCPEVCMASVDESETGSVPAGITYLVHITDVTPGTAPLGCASTCTICSAKVTVAFNGNGGYCMTYDQGGGWSTPVGLYARTGQLRSRCNDPTPAFVCFRIGSCATLPASPVFDECVSLNCAC